MNSTSRKVCTAIAALMAVILNPVLAGDATPLDADAITKLNEFSAGIAAVLKDAHGDEQLTKGVAEVAKLSGRITDSQLPTVEKFALTKEGETARWMLAHLLVDRGRFDAAAHLFVKSLSESKENRQYRMWKWWEYSFGERKDYQELSRQIGISLIHQFESGNAEYKLVVAELFGKSAAEAKLSVEEFKKAVDFDKKPSK